MSPTPITTPRDLAKELIRIFPEFAKEWDEGEGFGYTGGNFKFHTVFLTFAPVSSALLKDATPKQKAEFCSLINEMASQGGDFEDAVATCLLEHASAIGIRDQIEPCLSDKAKRELR